MASSVPLVVGQQVAEEDGVDPILLESQDSKRMDPEDSVAMEAGSSLGVAIGCSRQSVIPAAEELLIEKGYSYFDVPHRW